MAATPNFYLKSPKADESSIYMGIKLREGLFKYYTPCKVIPELFDKTTQRAIVATETLKPYKAINANILIEQKNINAIISNLESDTNRILSDLLKYDKVVTKDRLKEKLDEIYKPQIKKVDITSFNSYLDDFIDRCEKGVKLYKGKKYTKGTMRTYTTFRTLLNEYSTKLSFDAIDKDFYRSFVNFLNDKGYKINSVGKSIKFIKVIMKDAFEAGLHNNLIYSHSTFEAPTENADNVYLTEKELETMCKVDLTDKPNYALVRDVFIVGCYTALRYSDYSRIHSDMVKEKQGKYVLELNTTKTNTKVIIPLKPLVVDILKKYNFNLPKTHEQKLNQYIKEVCKLAGLNENVEINATIGGKRETSYKPKYEMVKTHTARRTGATLMYLAGVAPLDIMKITGHTKEANLLKYIKITKEQTADRLAANSFFK